MPRKLKNLSGRIVSRTGALPGFRLFAIVCALGFVGYCVYALAEGFDPASAVIACALLFVFLVAFIYLCLNPDSLRSQYTEQALSTASEMLDIIKSGLDRESAEAICRRLLPETRAMAIAVTDEEHVLACVGELEVDFPPGSPIHTPATRYVLDHGVAQSFTHMVDVRSERTEHRAIPAGIIVPLKVRDKAVGTLKFYYRRSHDVNRTQYALASGFAELLSTQLAIHELELQDELTARAELRALQAQINPHFLFNTLNTIASLTRTEPLRARELLREFSSFYRATLENSGSLIPVSREVAQTSRYLVFEKARFGEDRIRERFEIAPDAQDLPVPAFIIQPLVENAVRHGMTDEGPLTIEVSVSVPEQGFVLIEVADDGAGMDERTAARLFSTGSDTPAERAAADRSAPSGGGAGVAMRNISERIERFYGPRSSISVESEPGGGTSIRLKLDLENSILAERDVE
ncbi:histidine kinase [Candidatus Collinsella stercoripullorum]|uniref:histidine kinase n=1 Tax=Candidatus Collinsella stercoripullorum TaxID=2838522 RepID=UPI001C3C04EC|nr:histidine kinase [Candidatus Collinsella stercoripullorum]HJA01295.1 histidine kinase [Candidatus Collinsella stercoripullorum]